MGYLDRATLVVLSETAEIGLPEAAAVPIAAYDPLLRGALARRVAAAVERAEKRTSLGAGEHVLRLAFLLAHPAAQKDVDPDDERAVMMEYARLAGAVTPHLEEKRGRKITAYREMATDRLPEEPAVVAAPPPRKRPFWPVTTPLVATAVLALAAVGVALVVPYLVPSKIARFRKTPFGAALDAPLTTVVSRNGETLAQGDLLAAPVERQIGGAAHAELARVLAALPVARSAGGTVDEAMAPLYASLNLLDARLAEANVPAHLHGYATGYSGQRSVWITSYFVERRAEIDVGGAKTKVVWGRRLDSLNLNDSQVYKARAEDYAIVSLDLVDRAFSERVLPVLVRDRGKAGITSGETLSDEAHDGLASELRDVAKVSPGDANELEEALARRNTALVRIGKEGRRDVFLDAGTREALHGVAGSEVERLDREMHVHRARVDGAIVEMGEIVEASFVERIVDEQRFATSVFPRLGPSDATAGSRAKVAADLGAIARADCPRLALWLVIQKVSGPAYGPDRAAADTVLSLVAKELGATVDRSSLDFTRDVVRAAFAVPAAALSAAAARAYEGAFVEKLPSFARRTF